MFHVSPSVLLLNIIVLIDLNCHAEFELARWRQYVPPKRWQTGKMLHGAETQKTTVCYHIDVETHWAKHVIQNWSGGRFSMYIYLFMYWISRNFAVRGRPLLRQLCVAWSRNIVLQALQESEKVCAKCKNSGLTWSLMHNYSYRAEFF